MSGMIASSIIGGITSRKASKDAASANQKAIEANAWQGEMAKSQYDDYKTTYQPLERQMVANAQAYDSPEARNAAASEAQATVSSEIGKSQARLSRTVGFDPSSAAAQAAVSNLALSGAALGATAQNTARQGVKDKAYTHQLDALGMGKGLVANAATGMAAAASSARLNAAQSSKQGTDDAKGIGSMINGLAGGLSKVDWGKFSAGSGGGGTPNSFNDTNQYSGGNDGYTLANGESMGS